MNLGKYAFEALAAVVVVYLLAKILAPAMMAPL